MSKIDEKVKQDILSYCEYVFTKFINVKTLDDHNIPHAYFLEFLYRSCVEEYEISGESYELWESRINEIISILQDTETTFQKFKNKELQLVGINEFDLLQFNDEPGKEIFFNKQNNEWEYKDLDTDNPIE